MPLTPNALNHIRRGYRLLFLNRTTAVTLHFANKEPKTIPAIWRQQDTSDPEMLLQAKPPTNPQQATADAAFEVDLHASGTTIGELQSATFVVPSALTPIDDYHQASRYLPIAVQPKGMMQPQDRAYVMLRRA